MMVITEAKRFDMHTKLRQALGEEVADTLMEHLPPVGWGDVATKTDLVVVSKDVAILRSDIQTLRRDLDRIEKRLNWVIGIGTTVALALMGMQMQIMLSISHLKG
jgi:hypothetical protein